MRRLAAAVSVITCADEQQWFGLTATAVTSLCVEPASIIVCINIASSVLPALNGSRRFCVNLLTTEQHSISSNFGGRLKGAERFSEGHWELDKGGVPYLVGAQANLFCELDNSIAYGTHLIVIGLVTQVHCAEAVAPLIYQNGSYAGTAPLAASF
ncbi:flavin reductase family protein [Pseudomonas sp. C2L12B]|uniref:Flavin reductase family protein n=2 Tax=Pseudomonas typographi TaxID=2715964 RepID=A0ABR7Z7U9_9PSED|nr:flavin reductase family protein [Pseudomonas typographi]MBD1586389.1 flavin reductase family protein [Pseudomonas typographi]MBD1601348.1 flavin reductase family protein [Pseudomonas typographi]